ncbi:inositol monophosphatase family protein [Bacteriovorax sp. Seq25_V]|uniref:inositol monophosphatase family protein n=1 Tax=Bacteriovorax sp. Seq25_V TaxID=1201288 RepID=UPI000389E155|nr:inositol monophosphatase family protein [Bacteriovorax sp. Seq25_V]EQC47341.1 inositol monophosphatase family protein [Bacteriovorax sp. Seq25_V]
MSTKIDYLLLEKNIDTIAKKAGRRILKFRKKLDEVGVVSKDAHGIVSAADIDSEKFIVQELKKLYPEIPFLAEEQFYEEYQGKKEFYKKYENLPYLWVIDPLDGTNNFLHGLDYFAVCISLLKNGVPVAGVVHAPLRNETFLASKGNGTKYTSKNVTKTVYQKTGRKELGSCLLSTGFIRSGKKNFEKHIKQFTQLLSEVRAVRRMGSAALDLCYTSINLYDGFWEVGLAPWDMAAPAIICRESGVKVTKIDGSKHSVFVADVLSARNPIHKILVKKLSV